MLDNRSNRDPPDAPGPRAMLGTAQVEWLKKSLRSSRASFKIIACPTPMLADYPDESWGLFKSERDEFLAWIFQQKITGVLFLSGHRNMAELSCRQPPAKDTSAYRLYDLTSSSLCETPASPGQNADNPLRVGAALSMTPISGGSNWNSPARRKNAMSNWSSAMPMAKSKSARRPFLPAILKPRSSTQDRKNFLRRV